MIIITTRLVINNYYHGNLWILIPLKLGLAQSNAASNNSAQDNKRLNMLRALPSLIWPSSSFPDSDNVTVAVKGEGFTWNTISEFLAEIKRPTPCVILSQTLLPLSYSKNPWYTTLHSLKVENNSAMVQIDVYLSHWYLEKTSAPIQKTGWDKKARGRDSFMEQKGMLIGNFEFNA